MPRRATYRVTLTNEERTTLKELTSKGQIAAKKVLYARALLLLDEGEFGDAKWKVDAVATAVGLSDRTLEHLKKRFVEDNVIVVISKPSEMATSPFGCERRRLRGAHCGTRSWAEDATSPGEAVQKPSEAMSNGIKRTNTPLVV